MALLHERYLACVEVLESNKRKQSGLSYCLPARDVHFIVFKRLVLNIDQFLWIVPRFHLNVSVCFKMMRQAFIAQSFMCIACLTFFILIALALALLVFKVVFHCKE